MYIVSSDLSTKFRAKVLNVQKARPRTTFSPLVQQQEYLANKIFMTTSLKQVRIFLNCITFSFRVGFLKTFRTHQVVGRI